MSSIKHTVVERQMTFLGLSILIIPFQRHEVPTVITERKRSTLFKGGRPSISLHKGLTEESETRKGLRVGFWFACPYEVS